MPLSIEFVVVFSHEIADGLAAIRQLESDKTELVSNVRDCHEAHDKLCREKDELSTELDSSRTECSSLTSQLHVCTSTTMESVCDDVI